mgnify:CR=1 FL=1
MKTFHKGQTVTVSGVGRTARWGNITGTVVRTTKTSVFVQWHSCIVEDQMRPEELKEYQS